MSLTSALSIARSGLTASSRAAELTSQNVANALTEGYGRRELSLSSRLTGGVAVTGVTRFADRALIGDRRLAEAGAAASQNVAGFLGTVEGALGVPGKAGSLSALVSRLETALIDAAAQPQSANGLQAVVDAGAALTGRIGLVSGQIQTARQDAETQIEDTVTSINDALSRLESLNAQIAVHGKDVSGFLDQRQQLVDSIAQHIPLREMEREDGRIALISRDGAVLLDGKATTLGFEKSGVIVPGMTLSGLTLNGRALPVSGPGGIGGGALGAQFAVRDDLAPQAQAALDGFAADLGVRFEGTGLFSDAVSAEPWRLRDGLGALAPSAGGDGSRLNAMLAALTAGKGASGSAEELLSGISGRRINAESEAAFAAARSDTLRVAELAGGVDSDQEMQKLLLIEQSYAANAKVIQTIDAMMQALLRI